MLTGAGAVLTLIYEKEKPLMLGGAGLLSKTILKTDFEVGKMISRGTQNVKKFSLCATRRTFSNIIMSWAGPFIFTAFSDEKSRFLDRIMDGAGGGRK